MGFIFRLLGGIWIAIALLVFAEAVFQLIQGTSGARSQILRVVAGLLLILLAFALIYRFQGWRITAVLIAVLVGLREYVALAAPMNIVLTMDVVRAFAVLGLSLCTIALAVLAFRSSRMLHGPAAK